VIQVFRGILSYSLEQKKEEAVKAPEAPTESLSVSAKLDRTLNDDSGEIQVFVKPKKAEPIA